MMSVAMAKTSHGMTILISVVICLILIDGVAGGRRTLTDFEIRRQLKLLNKPPIKSIKSESGNIIDCVDIYKQPAFDHPLLKNHTIQMRPSHYDKKKMFSSKPLEQLWHKSGSCPNGTVPILRIRKWDLLRAERYGLKAVNSPQMENARFVVLDQNHGGEAMINVWNIHAEPEEFTTASIFVSRINKPDLVTAGWIVYKVLNGDTLTRLYTYWAADNGAGCYNLRCPGFVQTSSEVALGATLEPISIYGGNQYYFNVTIMKDLVTNNWLLLTNHKQLGYWPSVLFKNMGSFASRVEWGGQVSNTAPGGHHTTTQMGSGHFPDEFYGKAAYFANSFYFDEFNQEAPPLISSLQRKPGCYDIRVTGQYPGGPGADFLYGGPGGPDCDK